MEVSSSHQMYVFVLCVLAGALCGVFFDVQRSIRMLKRAGQLRTHLEDLLFAFVCVLTAIILGALINSGQMRYYQIMGLLSGALFYAAFLSRTVTKILRSIYRIFEKFIVVPLIKATRIILMPFAKLFVLSRKIFLKVKAFLRKIFYALKLRKKIFRKRMKML